jgi:hypothetical protein
MHFLQYACTVQPFPSKRVDIGLANPSGRSIERTDGAHSHPPSRNLRYQGQDGQRQEHRTCTRTMSCDSFVLDVTRQCRRARNHTRHTLAQACHTLNYRSRSYGRLEKRALTAVVDPCFHVELGIKPRGIMQIKYPCHYCHYCPTP